MYVLQVNRFCKYDTRAKFPLLPSREEDDKKNEKHVPMFELQPV
jgi:hypothetical protein